MGHVMGPLRALCLFQKTVLVQPREQLMKECRQLLVGPLSLDMNSNLEYLRITSRLKMWHSKETKTEVTQVRALLFYLKS